MLLKRQSSAWTSTRFLSKSVAGLSVRGMEIAGKFGLYVLVARVLGPHETGLFFLCMTWFALSSTAARIGLDRALTRHIAAELALGRGVAAARSLRLGLIWSTVGGVGIAVLTAVIAYPAAEYVFAKPDLAEPLRLTALAIAPQAVAHVAGGALIGLNRPIEAQLVQNGLWPVLTLAAVIVGFVHLDQIILALAAVLALCAGFALALIAYDRGSFSEARQTTASESEDMMEGLWQTALPLLIVEIVQLSLFTLPVLILGIFDSADAVGAFSTASRISLLIWVVIISVTTVAAPAFAEHHARGELSRLRSINRSVRLTAALLSLPLILMMMLVPSWLLGLIGPGYAAAATALIILAAGQMVNGLLASQDVVLAMTGYGKLLRTLNILQFTMCIILSLILIPGFGMLGAATAIAICTAQGAIGTTLAVRIKLPAAI